MEEEQLTMDLVPTSLAVKAMRDNGYRNAAYALAELIDNSIQAEASVVELLCADSEQLVDSRTRRRLSEVAVLDNGRGMDERTLRVALQFGNGSRLEDGKKGGMGRFGMGLPSASISQCKRVDVWSWQNGPDSALHSYIDLDEVERGDLREVPVPEPRNIPEQWLSAGESFNQTGTLVVWSQIDRALWRMSQTLINNSEELIGRMYRDWLAAESVRIRLCSFVSGDPGHPNIDKPARPNDPMYLLESSSCPDPYATEAMFSPFPSAEAFEIKKTILFRDEEHDVVLRFSMAKQSARETDNAGSTPAGRHAARNTGVSIIRADRELALDKSWINSYDPRERWWGAEIRFEPPLDELFGVANNKQSARNLTEAAGIDTAELAKQHGGSIAVAKRDLEQEDDPLAPLLDVVHEVQKQIRQMRKQIQQQGEGKRRDRRRHVTPEERATEAVRKRQEEGHSGRSDEAESQDEAARKAELAEHLVNQGHSPGDAEELAAKTINTGLKYRVTTDALDSSAFFSVQSRGGVIVVSLNSEHPAYDKLLGAKTPDELPDEVGELKDRLRASQEGLELMLFAWARYEDEQQNDDGRRRVQQARFDWGLMAEDFLSSNLST